MFPFGGELRRLELFGQNGDERRAGGGGQQICDLLGLPALHKTGGHQLFNDTGTGRRGSNALALGIIGHIFLARVFHRGQQRILGEVLGRRGFAGLDRCGRYGKRLLFHHHRQRGRCLRLLLLIALPAGSKNGFALGGEALTGTVHRNDRFCVAVGFIYGTEQAPCRQLQHLAFAQRQRGHVYLFRADGRDNSVVIGNFFAAAYLFGADGRRLLHAADSGSGGDKAGDAALHIVGQEAAVGARVGTELLFIERLEIVEGLLRGIAEDAVGVALESGQVIECGRSLGLFFSFHAFDHRRLALAGIGDSVGVLSVLHSVCCGRKAAIKLDGVERFCHKCGDLRLTLYQQRQRGRHDAPDVQCAAIRQGEIPCGVDAYQPIGLGAAEGGLMQAVIVAPDSKLLEAAADGVILH